MKDISKHTAIVFVFIAFVLLVVACQRVAAPDADGSGMIEGTDGGSTVQAATQCIRFVTYKKTYRIRPFEWDTTYYVPILNVSNVKVGHGTIVATAFYRFKPIYSRDIQHVVLQPQETMIVPVRLPAFHSPVASCLVTVKMIDEWNQGDGVGE